EQDGGDPVLLLQLGLARADGRLGAHRVELPEDAGAAGGREVRKVVEGQRYELAAHASRPRSRTQPSVPQLRSAGRLPGRGQRVHDGIPSGGADAGPVTYPAPDVPPDPSQTRA